MFYNHGYCFSEKSLCWKRAHFRKIVWNTGLNHWTLNRCIKTKDNRLILRRPKVRTIFTKCLRALHNDCNIFEVTKTFEHLYEMFFNHSCQSKQITPLLWCQIFPNKFRLLQNMNLIASLWKMSVCRCDYIIRCCNLRD